MTNSQSVLENADRNDPCPMTIHATEQATAALLASFEAEDRGQQEEEYLEKEELIATRTQAKEGYIDPSTRKCYQDQNKRFLLHLYTKRDESPVVKDTDLPREKYGTLLDETCITELGLIENDKSTPAAIKGKESRMAAKALELIQKARKSYQPIKLDELAKDSDMFLDFLLSRKGTKGAKYLSATGYGGYRSAMNDLFRVCGVSKPAVFEAELSRSIKGLVRSRAKANETSGSRLTEGKDPLPFSAYKFLAKKMLEESGSDAVFGHCFLVLTWNLMCRSKNTVGICIDHISWEGDALGIQFAHMKNDKEGIGASYKRHLYSNALDIAICPIVALSRYLATYPCRNGKLFDDGAYARFRSFLQKLTSKYAKEFGELGIDVQNIGVHSIRKGAATYACNGTTAAPQIAAICNRAGWTMGRVKDIYIKYEAAGDQYVGRILCGLNPLKPIFAQTPPFFRIDGDLVTYRSNERAREIENAALMNTEDVSSLKTCSLTEVASPVQSLFPNLVKTIQLKPVATMCFASLLLSMDFLQKCTHTDSPFKGSALFALSINKKLKEAVTVTYPWKTEFGAFWTHDTLTGIPPHVEHSVESRIILEKVEAFGKATLGKFNENRVMIVKDVVAELDKRNIEGGSLTMEMIETRFLCPVNDQMKTLTDLLCEVKDRMVGEASGTTTQEGSSANDASTGMEDSSYKWLDGKYHLLPEDFILPKKRTVLSAWYMWHLPHDDSCNRIRPLKFIHLDDIGGSEILSSCELKCLRGGRFRLGCSMNRVAVNAIQNT